MSKNPCQGVDHRPQNAQVQSDLLSLFSYAHLVGFRPSLALRDRNRRNSTRHGVSLSPIPHMSHPPAVT